jgi:pSer/pThr/pTyr-binding forkhead associated (FHA) protein
MRNLFLTAAFCLLLVPVAQAQTAVDIGTVTGNPGRYNDETVEVEGTVDRVVNVESESGTITFVLRSDAGATITVKSPGGGGSNQRPSVGSRLRVRGLVSVGGATREARIIEDEREVLSTPTTTASQQEGANTASQLKPQGSFWIIGLLVLGGAAIVGFLGYYAYQADQRGPTSPTPASSPAPSRSQGSASGSSAAASSRGGTRSAGTATAPPERDAKEQRIKSESSTSSSEDDSGPSTLKFKAPPKTMKYIPGQLVVATGPDQGKEFRIAGRSTPEGNVVTIGRAEVEGERAFSHIQLGETYRTVSRMQAEIIEKEDSSVVLKNKSTTNPTVVNDSQVPPDETVQLGDGDMIRMGELMLRYERDEV